MRRFIHAAIDSKQFRFIALALALVLAVAGIALSPATRADAGPAATKTGVGPVGSEVSRSHTPTRAHLDPDRAAVTLGTRFTATKNGRATAVRFYKVPGVEGVHSAGLWTQSGKLLARTTFKGETARGWQTAKFSSPVRLESGKSYVVGYHVSQGGRYATTLNARDAFTSKFLRVTSAKSGVYTYGKSLTFPTSTWKSSRYWIDLTFTATTPHVAKPKATHPPKTKAPSKPKPHVSPKPSASSKPSASPKPVKASKPPQSSAPTSPNVAKGTFPTASTAGLPGGWKPKKTVTGDMTITKAGTVVEDLQISRGTIYVQAKNVTLRRIKGTNVRVFNTAGAGCVGQGMVVEDSTFTGAFSNNGDAVIGDGGYTVRNVVINGAPEGLRVGNSPACGGVTVQNTYVKITPPSSCGDWHGDGIQGYGGGHLVVRNSTIIMEETNGCYGTAPFFYPNGQGNTSVDIDGLVVAGGGYPFRLGMPGSVVNLHVVNKDWGYGPVEVDCSKVSKWQASISTLNSAGQPVVARSLSCG